MIRWTSPSTAPRDAGPGEDSKMQRDLNQPNKLRHAQPTRKFVLKQPVFGSKQTSENGKALLPSPRTGRGVWG